MFEFLIDNNEVIYLGMVAQFYANLSLKNPDSNSILTSSVNQQPLEITYSLLNEIFGTTLEYPENTFHFLDDSHAWPQSKTVFNLSKYRLCFKLTQPLQSILIPQIYH